MRHRVALIIGTAVVVAAAVGLFGQDDRTIYGAGTNSCDHWTSARAGDAWLTSGQWILGFVSAANRYSKAPPTRSDARSMARWIDEYCRDHPTSDIADATQELVELLVSGRTP